MKERCSSPQEVPILFVEDDVNEILLLSRALSRASLPTAARFVQSPQELQDYLSGAGKFGDRHLFPVPQVILTKYRLCGASAQEVITSIRAVQQFRSVPIVVLSSFVPPREVDAILSAGARACIEKPLEFSGFCDVLQRAMKLTQN